jgi:hypothetical protein
LRDQSTQDKMLAMEEFYTRRGLLEDENKELIT